MIHFLSRIVLLGLFVLYPPYFGSASAFEFSLKVIESGTSSGLIQKEFHALVISNRAHFQSIYLKIRSLRFPPPPLPEIDFEKNRVLIAFMGQQTTSGYVISFGPKVQQNKKELQVKVLLNLPPSDAVLLQILTSPYVIAVIERGTYEAVSFLSNEDELFNTVDLSKSSERP